LVMPLVAFCFYMQQNLIVSLMTDISDLKYNTLLTYDFMIYN